MLTAAAVTAIALCAAGVGSMLLRGRPFEILWARWLVHNAPTAPAITWACLLLVRERPRHRLGQVGLLVGVLLCLHVAVISLADARLAAAGYAEAAAVIVPASLPLDASVPYWISAWLWVLPAGMAITVLLLLFPDGEPPPRRWRWVLPVSLFGIGTLALVHAVEAWPGGTSQISVAMRPGTTGLRLLLLVGGGLAVLAGALGSTAALLSRWRAAAEPQRTRIRSVVMAAAVMAITMTVTWPWEAVWVPLSLVTVWLFVGAYLLAVLQRRLYDLDVVISKAVLVAVLAALVTGAYLGIVVGVGGLLGRAGERTWLPLAATAVVALAFEPTRRRVRRLVDRMIYGRQASPYEVLTDLADRMGRARSPQEVLDHACDLLVRSTGAERVDILLLVGGTRRLATTAGDGARADLPVVAVPVRHGEEQLGVVELHARAQSALVRDARTLAVAVAGALGVVLRNALLATELQDQLEELRRSRQRLVEVHDRTRRELERDIHDGAQSRLVALRIRLGLATAVAEREQADDTTAVLAEMSADVDAAVRSLRDLSRGLHPAVLRDTGVTAALRAAARDLPVLVTVEATCDSRYEPAVEGAVYFSCLEAIQNAVRHGHAERITVSLRNGAGSLAFTVTDDGRGFDPGSVDTGRGLGNISDRVSALGGTVALTSQPGSGTVVRGEVPVQPLVSDR
jgi:two-component system, NarL family, sensor kinase